MLHLSSRCRKRNILPVITFNEAPLKPVEHVRNLSIIFDNHLTMINHIKSICRSSSYALHMIGKMRQFLDQATTEKLVHAFLMSRIDNCNRLLFRLPTTLLAKIQRIQNSAARIVLRRRSYDSISMILNELHWLPVKKRIVFKLLIIAYKCRQGIAPQYLQDLVHAYQPGRNLRSSIQHLFVPHSVLTRSYGQRTFQYAIPELWNSLPLYLKECPSFDQFKFLLKTYLFNA